MASIHQHHYHVYERFDGELVSVIIPLLVASNITDWGVQQRLHSSGCTNAGLACQYFLHFRVHTNASICILLGCRWSKFRSPVLLLTFFTLMMNSQASFGCDIVRTCQFPVWLTLLRFESQEVVPLMLLYNEKACFIPATRIDGSAPHGTCAKREKRSNKIDWKFGWRHAVEVGRAPRHAGTTCSQRKYCR